MKKRTSSANIFAKECIFTALMMLMEENDYDNITVTDITNRAGVSRVTYYRNYNSKNEILISYFDELFHTLIEEFKQNKFTDEHKISYKLISFIYHNKRLILNLKKANQLSLMATQFQNFARNLSLLQNNTHKIEINYGFHYIFGGLYFIILEWLETGMKESVDDITNMFNKFISNVNYIKTK